MNAIAASLIALAVVGTLGASRLNAQEGTERSIVRTQQELYGRYGLQREQQWDSVNGRAQSMPLPASPRACTLGKRVFGWNPYWEGTAYNNFDFSLLSDVCYFSYEVDPATGSYTDIHSWKTTQLVDRANSAGVRVHLCATLFSGIGTFLANSASRATLIDSLLALVQLRGAGGVNIDFEGVPAGSRAAMASFMTDLANRFHSQIPGSQISIALPAVDWSNAFDVAAMAPYVDLFLIMGYDYHWSSAPDAGPVAPKNSGTLWGSIDVTRSVNAYLARGVPASRLALAVPYYGYDWPTADSTLGAATTGAGTAVLYTSARAGAELHGRQWEPQSSTPYYIYRSGDTWHQAWYDDEESLRAKYDLVTMKGLAGIGIWALGYDDGRSELWSAIEKSFTTCAASPCSGTFTDMGGPAGNYYDGDNYIYTIAPENAASVTLAFFSFNVANDRLRVYDGRDTLAPLIGNFTGTGNPGTITGNHGALTLAFASDAAQNSWGWIANWSCSDLPQDVPDRPAPEPASVVGVFPNPSSGAVTIACNLRSGGHVRLSIFDMLGAERAVLFDGARQPGHCLFHFDNSLRRIIPSGLYDIRLHIDGERSSDAQLVVVD